jgi:hypothetical protein
MDEMFAAWHGCCPNPVFDMAYSRSIQSQWMTQALSNDTMMREEPNRHLALPAANPSQLRMRVKIDDVEVNVGSIHRLIEVLAPRGATIGEDENTVPLRTPDRIILSGHVDHSVNPQRARPRRCRDAEISAHSDPTNVSPKSEVAMKKRIARPRFWRRYSGLDGRSGYRPRPAYRSWQQCRRG